MCGAYDRTASICDGLEFLTIELEVVKNLRSLGVISWSKRGGDRIWC